MGCLLLAAGQSLAMGQDRSAPRRLDLRAAVAAARRNPPFVLAAARQATARAHELRAAEHARLPTLALLANSDFGVTHEKSALVDASGAAVSTHASLAGNLALLDFGRRGHAIDAARAAVEGARAQHAATRLAAALSVSRLFLQVRSDEAMQAALGETLEERRRLGEAVQALVAHGLRPQVDLMQAQTETARQELELAIHAHRTNSDRIALAASLGLSTPDGLELSPVDERLLAIDDDPALARRRVLGQDPELQVARARYAEADAQQARVASESYPELALRVASALDRTDWLSSGAMPSQTLAATGGIAVQWTVFDASIADRARAAAADLAVARAQLQQIALERGLQAEQTAYAVREAGARLLQAQQLFAAYDVAVRAQEERYKVGEASLIEVLRAQDNRQSARYAILDASLAYDTARIALKFLVAGSAALER